MARFASGISCILCTMIAFAHPAAAQVDNGRDTRLRLDQQLDRRRSEDDRRTLEDAEPDAAPSTIVIDGQSYTVRDTVDDVGKALYIAIGRRQWRDVDRFLAAYRKLDGHDAALVLYAQGALARNAGRLSEAESRYRALLAAKPDFLPAQLELARVLFENHKDREAQRAFRALRLRLVTEGAHAEGVLRSVDTFAAALARRNGWQGNLAFGPSYSTNVNQSSQSYACLLSMDDGTCLIDRKVPDAIKAAGLSFEGVLNRRVPLAGHGGVRARVIAFGDIYPQHHRYSQATAIVRVGYDYQTSRDQIALSPSFELGTLGSSALYRAAGGNFEWTHTFSPRFTGRFEGNLRRFDYTLSGYQAQSGPLGDVGLTGWYALTPSLTLFAGVDLAVKNTPGFDEGYRQWGGRIGANKAFGQSVNLFVLGSYRQRRNRTYSELFAATRKDDQYNVTAIASAPALKFAGLVPELVLQYARVESTVDWLYSYRRTSVALRLGRNF
ncbi:hypothetical protein A8V01_16345 [Novosphingobium guangzhouense]|uniref:Peptide signal n=2 Tax=Novosphingobium guangzhouense TaxID=1850347 RepID=A0A2K2G3E1_9SPHN|nr:hypothetical protein A8V01_16345 [Novosphingobium guangzhouense]